MLNILKKIKEIIMEKNELKPIEEVIKKSTEETNVMFVEKRIADLEKALEDKTEECEKQKQAINSLARKCQEFEITVRTMMEMFTRK